MRPSAVIEVETRETFLWDKLDEVEHSDLLMFHYTRGAGKSLARPGRKQATATEDFDFHISYL